MKRTLCLALVGLGMLLCVESANAQLGIELGIKSPLRFRYFDARSKQYLPYEFGKRAHVDRIAYELSRNANAVCWTAHRYYQGNPGWSITYKEMYQLVTDAEHIQKLVKEGYYRTRHDKDHIVKDLLEMDKLVDHVRSDVRYWYRDESKVDPLHSRRIDNDDTILVRLAKLEDTLHHLMRDYGVPFGNARRAPGTAPAPGGLTAPRPN